MFLVKIFCIITSLLALHHSYAEPTKPIVAVVGAGLAGLTTAYRLHQKGVDVQVYEARNRVGGRIFSVKMGDAIGELGGQSIADGGKAENIYRFIEEFHLDLKKSQVNLNAYYFNNGTLFSRDLLNSRKFDPEELNLQLKEIAKTSKNMRDVLNGLLEENDPFYKVLSVRLAGYEGASIEKLSPLYVETLYHMLLGGLSAAHQTAGEKDQHVGLVSIKGGNALLPEKLSQSLGHRVHLNMPLVSVSKAKGVYELLFQNGQKVKADILVLAIPCSVYGDILFEENLIPDEKLIPIRNIQYGTNAKILVPFAEPPSKRISFLNDRIAAFFDTECTILTLYYTRETGRFSKDSILDAYLQERPMLEAGFGELCPPLSTPSYAQDGSLISYVGPVGYSWSNDPFVKGSYSYVAAGQEDLLTATQEVEGETVKSLFAPIDQTLFFAGEHASILMDVGGTMEAACESGERTARMIEKVLRSFSKKEEAPKANND